MKKKKTYDKKQLKEEFEGKSLMAQSMHHENERYSDHNYSQEEKTMPQLRWILFSLISNLNNLCRLIQILVTSVKSLFSVCYILTS